MYSKQCRPSSDAQSTLFSKAYLSQYLGDNCIRMSFGEVNRPFYSRTFRFTVTRLNAVTPILMHLFIFPVEKLYYLHKATSAVSCVKPNASQ